MRAALILIACAVGCAAPAEIHIDEAARLIDSYPGNGATLPSDRVSPLMFRFSQALDPTANLTAAINLRPVGSDGEPAGTSILLDQCTLDDADRLLVCGLAGELANDVRYAVDLDPGLAFASGETLAIAIRRWFQTLP
jgi:hypothetical protein